MSVPRVVVFGGGQTASYAHMNLCYDSPYDVVGFTVDRKHRQADALAGLPVVDFETVEYRFPPDEHKMFIPISFRDLNRLRAEKYHVARAKGYELVSYVSSRAATWPDLRIGDNCMIHEGCVVQPFVEIGSDVTMGAGSVVAHHSVVRNHCFLGPNAVVSGFVEVGAYTFLGANCTIKDGVTVGSRCIIGAGVAIHQDVPDKSVWVGPRSQRLKRESDELSALLTWSS